MTLKPMRNLAAFVLPLLLTIGCGGETSSNLSFTGTLAPHANEKMFLALLDTSTPPKLLSQLGTLETVVGPNGAFSLTVPNLDASQSYQLAFYADHNLNGQCDSPFTNNAPNVLPSTVNKVDHSWIIPVNNGSIGAGAGQTFNHNINFIDVCDYFKRDLTFSGSLPPHIGQQVSLAVIDDTDSSVLTKAQTQVDSSGNFSLTWPALLRDSKNYHVEFYAESNGNTTCDEVTIATMPADHMWSEPLTVAKGAAVTYSFIHRTPFDAVCNTFKKHALTFNGSASVLHAGQLLSVALVADQDGILAKKGDVIERMSTTSDTTGFFSFAFTAMAENGLSYHVDLYADHNGDGRCDAPPVDHSWRESIGVISAPTIHTFNHRAQFDAVCASFPNP